LAGGAGLKGELRRAAERTPDALHRALGSALATVTPQNAVGCFRHCGHIRSD
jgi:hypothetical protein